MKKEKKRKLVGARRSTFFVLFFPKSGKRVWMGSTGKATASKKVEKYKSVGTCRKCRNKEGKFEIGKIGPKDTDKMTALGITSSYPTSLSTPT